MLYTLNIKKIIHQSYLNKSPGKSNYDWILATYGSQGKGSCVTRMPLTFNFACLLTEETKSSQLPCWTLSALATSRDLQKALHQEQDAAVDIHQWNSSHNLPTAQREDRPTKPARHRSQHTRQTRLSTEWHAKNLCLCWPNPNKVLFHRIAKTLEWRKTADKDRKRRRG